MTAQQPRPSKNPARPPTESSASETESGSAQDAKNQVAVQQQQGGRRREGRQRQVYEYQQGEDGATAQQVAPQNGRQQVQGKGKGAPSVRLDMDLDVEIELKAKIQGDLTLSILGGNQEKRK
ncbi:hypothetical protein CKAH01_08820 [Colletotrichum kahawae]|uniref:Uncharacterized protein n=1 Tax=Colletotrichum kahawae TaxID=34407 RepID=A0AAD9XZW5_COLKA|nr:hypothetical protein CKAH01_08820 [Colletotrichum kahawae]